MYLIIREIISSIRDPGDYMKYRRLIACGIVLAMLAGCSQVPAEETAELTEPQTVIESEAAETSAQTEPALEETEPSETTEAFVLGDDGFLPEYETFELTSEDIHNGVWDDVISCTLAGENVSPQLSFDPVDDALFYVIYMVDTTAYNFIHWAAYTETETDLDRGWATGATYMGPYPPSGSTHTYDIYVVALRNPIDRIRGTVNTQNPNFAQFIRGLDTDADGSTGNIISYGYLSGEFTAP